MENSSTLTSVGTAIGTMISDYATAATSVITTNLPVIGGIVGAIVLIRFGFKFLKFGK